MTFTKNLNAINMYLCLDLIVYSIFIFIMVLFVLWNLGLHIIIKWLYDIDLQRWLELGYITCILLIIGSTGYLFTQLLEYMDQNLIIIKKDRLFLLQQNMDLLKENKEIKKVLKNMMQNISEEDKKSINSY